MTRPRLTFVGESAIRCDHKRHPPAHPNSNFRPDELALTGADVAKREGFLDRTGRILETVRARCPDARLEEALAESWLEQGRLAAVARLLATPTALAPAVRSSIAGRLEQARQHPRDPDALLEKARAAKRRGDAVHARRHYDQALARLSASLDEGEAPTLLFLEPATPHRLDDDYLGPPSGTDDGDLHLYPARRGRR